jgi:broad specificity phosphatase PhoE
MSRQDRGHVRWRLAHGQGGRRWFGKADAEDPPSAAPEQERTVVHLLRHGEVHNPEGVLYGRLPGFVLSAMGHQMAKAAARALDGHDLAAVVTSPLERARETSVPIAEAFGLEAEIDNRLIEAGNVFEGRTFGVGDGSLRRPAYWRHLVNPFRPSWGEPYAQIAARMLAAMGDARDRIRGREAICVSHQLPIWTVRSHVEGRRLWHDPRRRECALASLTSFVYDGDHIVEVTYREPAAHLVPRPVREGRGGSLSAGA